MRTLSQQEVSLVSGSGLLLDLLRQNPLLDIDFVHGPVGSLKIHVGLLLLAVNLNITWHLNTGELPDEVFPQLANA
jgi:hypothetical protein